MKTSKNLGFAFLAFIGALSFAEAKVPTYNLKMNLALNAKHISSPSMTVRAGEAASITQKDSTSEAYFIDVLTTNAPKNLLHMKFTIGKISSAGERTVLSQASITTRENSPAKITEKDERGRETLSLSVIANKL